MVLVDRQVGLHVLELSVVRGSTSVVLARLIAEQPEDARPVLEDVFKVNRYVIMSLVVSCG